MQFLLYGANGYTAGLIIKHASSFGLTPVLAGRSEAKVKAIADANGLTYRVADLQDAAALDAMLQGMQVVLHCAGPFSKTAKPMQVACLRNKVHYLDITGEIEVFEQGMTQHEQALQAGIMIMSGVGFDVVPTDCMALHLKQRLPDATLLQLAFSNIGGKLSHGTALTMAEGMGRSNLIRKDGQITAVPSGRLTLDVPFSDKKPFTCMAIPWGDVSTAYRTTGIPNIITYIGLPMKAIRAARLSRYFGWLLQTGIVQRIIKKRIDKQLAGGPDEQMQRTAQTRVWGRVTNAKGETAAARLTGIEGYTMTALTALNITQKVLQGNFKTGYQTPAGAYGADLILEIPGMSRVDLATS